MIDNWDIFNALTCMHPAIADITDNMLPPFNDRECERIRELRKEDVKQREGLCNH